MNRASVQGVAILPSAAVAPVAAGSTDRSSPAGSTWRYLANGTQPGHRVAGADVHRHRLDAGRRAARLRRRRRGHGRLVRAQREPEVRHDLLPPPVHGRPEHARHRDAAAQAGRRRRRLPERHRGRPQQHADRHDQLDHARHRRRRHREPVLLVHDPDVGVRERRRTPWRSRSTRPTGRARTSASTSRWRPTRR